MLDMFQIFWQVLSPIFLMIFAGYAIQKRFDLTLTPMTKVQLYLFVPSLIFLRIATSELENGMVLMISGFTIVLYFILMGLSFITAKAIGMERKTGKAFINAVTLRNQGNFTTPLITLLYASAGNEFPLSVHMIVLFITNLLLNTFGLYIISSGTYTKKEALIKVLRLPMIYVVIAGFVFKGWAIPIPAPIFSALSLWGDGVVPLALFILGAQLANTDLKLSDRSLPIVVAMRLILSPILAYGLTILFGITGIVAEILIVGAAAPTAVNSVLYAIEFKGDADYASESVLVTTLLSAVTVTLTILIVL